MRALHPGFVRICAVIALLVAGLALLRVVWPRDLWILLPGVVLSVRTPAVLARTKLSISDTFPEVARWRLLERLLG